MEQSIRLLHSHTTEVGNEMRAGSVAGDVAFCFELEMLVDKKQVAEQGKVRRVSDKQILRRVSMKTYHYTSSHFSDQEEACSHNGSTNWHECS